MEYKVIDAASATSNKTSNGFNCDSLPVRPKTLGVHVITSSDYTGTTATVKIQHSNIDSDAYYKDITDASVTLSGSDDSKPIAPITDIGMKYYRAVYDKGNASAGDYTVSLNFN